MIVRWRRKGQEDGGSASRHHVIKSSRPQDRRATSRTRPVVNMCPKQYARCVTETTASFSVDKRYR
jgi:hypothetical protein